MNTELPVYTPIGDARIAELTYLAIKAGAHIHILRRIRVKQDHEWQDAINLVGQGALTDPYIFNPDIIEQYRPISDEVVETDIVLLGYPKNFDGDWYKSNDWGKEAQLNACNPREVFAIGVQKPNLNKALGQNPMYVVAPIDCSYQGGRWACCVWWCDSECEPFLLWIESFNGPEIFFAFREPELNKIVP